MGSEPLTTFISEGFDLFTRRVTAAPTRVAVTATDAAVSGSADVIVEYFLPCNGSLTSIQDIK